ncbi:MAG: FUSC family protein [Bdellovibrio sp.]
MKVVVEHTKALFKNTDEAPPWARMTICSLATGIPLLVGWWQGELNSAIYASLLGYFVALNDHLGSLVHRLLVATLSFVALIAAFVLGVSLHEHFAIFISITLLLTYWLGLMGGLGAEAERLLLFSSIQILVAYYTPRMGTGSLDSLLHYGLIGYSVVLLGMVISNHFLRGKTLEYARLHSSLLSSLTFSRRRHIYAFSYMVAALLAILCIQYFVIERGYWTIVTVMLIMKPDHKESVYRSLQRFIGTLVGVGLGEALIVSTQSVQVLIIGVMISAFLIPYAMKRNYWLVSFFVSIVVMFLLSIPVIGHPDTHLPFVRLEATLYGCLLSVVGVLLFKVIEKIFIKIPTQ